MVCRMKEYLKQSLEVWGHLNWTLFPLREALRFRSINACSFMLTSLWTIRWNSIRQDSARLCSSNGQSRSCNMLVTLSCLLYLLHTKRATLNCFQELNVVLCVWIPYWSCVFHLGPEDRLESHILYLSRAVFEVSTQDSKCLICL